MRVEPLDKATPSVQIYLNKYSISGPEISMVLKLNMILMDILMISIKNFKDNWIMKGKNLTELNLKKQKNQTMKGLRFLEIF